MITDINFEIFIKLKYITQMQKINNQGVNQNLFQILDESRGSSIDQNEIKLLMDKVTQLYKKLQIQIIENTSLNQQNCQLNKRIKQLQKKQQKQQTFSIQKDKVLFNLFIQKISNLENQNRLLKQSKNTLQNSKDSTQQTFFSKQQNQKFYSKFSNSTIPKSPDHSRKITPCNSIIYSPRHSNELNFASQLTKLNLENNSQKTKRIATKFTARKSIDEFWHSPNQFDSKLLYSKLK